MTPKTLDQYTPEQRGQMVGMWCDYDGIQVIICTTKPNLISVFDPASSTRMGIARATSITPRFDLLRAWTPDGKPVPAKQDDDNGHNLMRRWITQWEWKSDEELRHMGITDPITFKEEQS